jgi:hypothetical protein
MRHTQLGESATSASTDTGVLHGVGEHFDDLVVASKVGEVFERKVDRTHHRARAAQIA